MNWDIYVGRTQKSSACLSLFLNFILILLIIKKSPQQLGSYRYLMIYTALFEVIYSIIDVFLSPIIYSHGSMFLVIVSAKNSRFSKHILFLVVCLWCGFFGGFMMLFCIQFIYRYLVVIGSKSINSFKSYRIVYWSIIPILFGMVNGAVVYNFMGPRVQTDNVLRNVLLAQLDILYENITYMGPQCYYKTANGNSVINTDAIFSITYSLMVMTMSISCISYCAIKTFLKIRETLNLSSMESRKFNRLQSQTFYALVTQALIPVILMHFPCMVIMFAAILEIALGHASGIVSITFALFPALDPLPVMLIIKNYRDTLLSVVSIPFNVFVR